MLKKIIIQETATAYIVQSLDTLVLGVLEEELQQLAIKGVSTSYGGKVASLEVTKNQGEGPDALDKENWLVGAIDALRPTGYPNWETAIVFEFLSYDEGAPCHYQEVREYVTTRQAPQEFYELFEAAPAGDLKVINWSLIASELQR